MADHWYVARGKETSGPFTAAQLKALISQGRLLPTDMLHQDGTPRWVAASSVQGLFAASTATAAPPPLPPVTPQARHHANPPTAARKAEAPAVAPSAGLLGRKSVLWASIALGVVTMAVVGIVLLRHPGGFGLGFPDGVDGEQPLPEYVDLARLIVNEYRTESKGLFLGAPASAPPLKLEDEAGFSRDEAPGLGLLLENLAGRDSTSFVPIFQPDQLLPVLDRLAKTSNPVLRTAVEKFEQARRRGPDIDKYVDAHVEGWRKQVGVVTEAARRGAYVRTIPAEVERVRTDDGAYTDRVVRPERDVDDGAAAIDGAMRAAQAAEENAPAHKKNERHRLLEEARVEAWKAMEPRLAGVYPRRTAAALVEFHISDYNRDKKAEFTAVNSAGRVLTQVTLIVQVHHFLTTPEATSYRVYYIPRWEIGQTLYLSLYLWRGDAEASKGRPPEAYPGYSGKNWLQGMGGVVKVRSIAWAAEANQPETVTSFPAAAEEGAQWEMRLATGSLADKLRTWQRQFGRVGSVKFTLPGNSFELQSARRVLTYAAADSEPAKEAKRLIENPEAYANQKAKEQSDRLAEQLDRLAKRTEPGTRLVGDWKMTIDDRDNRAGLPPDVLKNKDNHGKVALRFETRDLDARTITATLYDPDHPEIQKALKGVIRSQPDGKLTMDFSRVIVQPKPQRGVRPPRQRPDPPERWDLLKTDLIVKMWFEGDTLIGATPTRWYLSLNLQPSKEVPPPAKK
jgi:hypothetical protein